MDTYFPKPRFACFEKMVIHDVEDYDKEKSNMTDKGLLVGTLIISGGMIISAILLQPPRHSKPEVFVSPSTEEVRQTYIQGFIEQVIAKTPDLGHHQRITKVDVEGISISQDGAVLTIIPRIMWTKQDSPTQYSCELKADGFGGFAGKYSPMSDNTKEIYIQITGFGSPTR
jgi:hypothetical protein